MGQVESKVLTRFLTSVGAEEPQSTLGSAVMAVQVDMGAVEAEAVLEQPAAEGAMVAQVLS